MSLIDTALKFTSIGSVRLHAGATDEDGRLRLRFDVTDTGVGLSRAVQERLFQPCVQIDGAIAGQGGDAGLDLPIARKLAELMGGVVGCESVVGQGSLYWFTLPAEQAGAGAPAAKQAKEGAPQGRLSGHVLVVEDNAVNRMLIGTYLEEFGLTHEMVDSGGGAVMNLATKTYDLVLMDIMMPDLDGIETTKRIRSLHAPSSEVPIVALVAPAVKGNCGAYLSAGMDAYVAKPIRGRELYAALAPLLAAGQPELKLKLVKA